MTAPFRVGIVGCGEVTQILHLPALRQLPSMFEVVAVCDASRRVVSAVSASLPAVRIFHDYRELITIPAIDVVVVANPDIYHAEVAIAAMEAGKHVFIEKPMCMTIDEAEALARTQRKTGRLVQVGYMRRYADAFLKAKSMIAESASQIRHARVHDFFGAPAEVTNSTSLVVRPTDLDVSIQNELREVRRAKIKQATGSDDDRVQMSYSVLLGLSTHDISAMRELLGEPRGLRYASHRHDGRNIAAAFDYGDYICEFSTGMDDLPRFDTHIEVYMQSGVVRLEYETPYVRNLPARLSVQAASTPTGISTVQSFDSRTDAFVLEWRAFHESLVSGIAPKTSIADSRADLQIFKDIIGAIVAEGWRPTTHERASR